MGWQLSSRRNSSHWAPGILSVQASLFQQKICRFWRFSYMKMYHISKPGKTNLCKALGHLMVLLTTETTGTTAKLQIRKANTFFTNNWAMQELWHFTWGILLIFPDRFSGLCSCTTFSLSAVILCNAHFMFILQCKSSHKMQAAQKPNSHLPPVKSLLYKMNKFLKKEKPF